MFILPHYFSTYRDLWLSLVADIVIGCRVVHVFFIGPIYSGYIPFHTAEFVLATAFFFFQVDRDYVPYRLILRIQSHAFNGKILVYDEIRTAVL